MKTYTGFSYALIYTKSNILITEYVSSAFRRLSISRFSNRSSIISTRASTEQLEEVSHQADESSRSGSFNASNTCGMKNSQKGPF